MTTEELQAVAEALLLTSPEPVTLDQLVAVIDDDGVTRERLEDAIQGLKQEYERPGHGVRLERVAGGWRFVTLASLDPYIREMQGVRARQKLSQAALEVLAIAAYRQPVTLPEINFIRGVNSAGVVRTLLDRKLLRVAGRKKVVGKPFLYRTTKEFLVHFGLERPEDLPTPEELQRA